MKQFFLSVAFVLGGMVVPVKASAPKATWHSKVAASVSAESKHAHALSMVSKVLDPAATEETRHREIQPLFKRIQKYPLSGLVLCAAGAPAPELELSSYLFHALCRKVRLEGPDLIFPHYYSW